MPQLTVDQLTVRMPGADTAQAERLAIAIVHRLAAHPLATSGDLGRLEVRVPWPDGATDDRLADRIADAILEVMHHAT